MRRNILNVTANMHRWKLSALAAAAFVTAAMTSTDAAALALGPLRVESALGENLRADIAIPQATATELNNLVARMASPEVFRAQGMDYSNAARSIQVQLLRKADGTASLRLTSNAPVQDPFVDVIIETQWSTGQLVRSYTMLLDPPAAQRSAPAPTIAPQLSLAAPALTGKPTNTERQRPTSPAAAANAAPAAASSAKDDAVRVRAGDTAGRIANANRPAGVSLDQMLVAMLRSNPKAFINGNVNRLRSGAVMQMPSREQALKTSAPEARQIVAAQSRDFNAYRRSLASKAPQAAVQAADRSSSGQVQAHVAETRPAADTPDKLTLSQGAVQNTAVAEEKLAAQKQADDQDNRLSELQRNLTELNQLAGTTPDAATPTATTATASTPASSDATAPAAPAVAAAEPTTLAAPVLDVANATAAAIDTPASGTADTANAADAPNAEAAPVVAQDSPTEAAAPAPAATTAPAKAAKKPARVAPVAPVAEPSLTDTLLENPLVPAGAGLVALLLGWLGYSAWKRRRAAQAAQDPSLGDSQLQADSFFGSSGGQQVDTNNVDDGASTMAYAPSQLDGGGDVDPVAEADVYLAYGRDVQAEEILKEALRNQPERLSVHVKLAEIYVKRHDIKALEATARNMQTVSQGPEWQRVMDMGHTLNPSHPFFAAAGTPSAPNPAKSGVTAAGVAATAIAVAPPLPDLDLPLDLPAASLTSGLPAAATPVQAAAPQPSSDDLPALELPSTWDQSMDLSAASVPQDPPTLVQDTLMGENPNARDVHDLDLDLSGFEMPAPTPVATPAQPGTNLDGLDFDLDSLSIPAAVPAAPETPFGADFDLGSLDLDLGPTAVPATQAQPVHNLADDSLSTKLDLAQEFNAIGDSEGARALIEEVLAEASGALKDRAHKLLSELD